MAKSDRFIGIDVSKDRLDVHVLPEGKDFVFSNDVDGIAALCRKFGKLRPQLIVLEATGGLQIPVASALGVKKHPVAVINPGKLGTSLVRPGDWPKRTRSMHKF